MKRKIKFRCWFPKGTDTGNGEIEKGEMCYDLAFENYEPVNDLLNSVEHLMQFTGLKDKNGNEIYESDICRAKGGVIGFIDFHNGRFCWTDGAAHWDMVFNNPSYHCLIEDKINKCEDLEVIGNIYENQELFK